MIMKEGNQIVDINYAVMERIRSLCAKRGITTGELIKLSGLNPATIYEIIGGRSKHPSIKSIMKIANGFDMNLVEFFDDPLFLNIHT